MDVCTPGGYVQRSTVSKANLHHIPSLYTALRKTTWGGLYPVLSTDDNRNALARSAKGTRIRSEADDASVYPEHHARSLDPSYRSDDSRSTGKKAGKGYKGKDHERATAWEDDSASYNSNQRGGSMAGERGAGYPGRSPSPRRGAEEKESRDYSPPSRGSAQSGKVRMEEMTASAGSAQYRKLQAQAYSRETAMKENKSFGGANSGVTAGKAVGSAGGAGSAPKSGLAGQLERMKRRREEKAREQQQKKSEESSEN